MKPFLGGYRHKLTGTVFHHATTQTKPPPWKYNVEQYSRETQTIWMTDKAQQTDIDAWTQVEVAYIHIFIYENRILLSTGRYELFDSVQARIEAMVLILQKSIRRWLARQELRRRKERLIRKILWDKEQAMMRIRRQRNWLQEMEQRKQCPKEDDDFLLLFSDIQKWQNAEENIAAEVCSSANLQAAKWMIEDEETEKIKEINRKRKETLEGKMINQKKSFLFRASKPKLWKAYKGHIVVETENSQLGRTLYELYRALSVDLSPEDRMDALMTLIDLVKPLQCPLTSNIVKLATREIDLLVRGIKNMNLKGLRTRIQNLFWQYCKQPEMNPETGFFSKLLRKEGKWPHIISCASCKRFYVVPYDSIKDVLGKSVLGKRFTRCEKCIYLENESWIRKDQELYKKLLKFLRFDEEKKATLSSIIYDLQPQNIGFLVEKIWRSQSCLSGVCDKNDLLLSRWIITENWTPWNCLLVTTNEAVSHNHITDFKNVYGRKFVKHISKNHKKARRYFSKIPRFLPYLSSAYIDNNDSTSVDESSI